MDTLTASGLYDAHDELGIGVAAEHATALDDAVNAVGAYAKARVIAAGMNARATDRCDPPNLGGRGLGVAGGGSDGGCWLPVVCRQ